MEWQEVQRRLLGSLHDEIRKQWGGIRKIEERLGISDGYLGKLCQGKHDVKLSLFLRSIATLGLDHRSFLSRALELQPEPDDFLQHLEDPRERDPAYNRLARATSELEAADPPCYPRPATAGAEDVAAVAACGRTEQLRRLRAGRKYRTHAFTRAYLEHLDTLRYDDAEEAAVLAARVATHLIPALPGPQENRLALQCLALSVFGSARRLRGKFGAATQALRLALAVARRAGLREDRANLLIRAAYVLRDFGHFQRALALLNEALVIFVRLGSRWDIGRALVDHGMIRSALGDYEEAVLDLERALEHLAGSELQLSRHHLSAYQFTAYAYEQLGQLDKAHEWLEKGANAFEPQHAVDAAKLQWQRGRFALRHGQYAAAEELLRAAGAVLASKEFPGKEALLTLDLISALLAQGKHLEASDLATNMTPLLVRFKNNRFAEAAIFELINKTLEGKLHEGLICEIRQRIEKKAHPSKGALLR